MTTPNADENDGVTRILFADNDPILADAIPELLRTKGYEVHGFIRADSSSQAPSFRN